MAGSTGNGFPRSVNELRDSASRLWTGTQLQFDLCCVATAGSSPRQWTYPRFVVSHLAGRPNEARRDLEQACPRLDPANAAARQAHQHGFQWPILAKQFRERPPACHNRHGPALWIGKLEVMIDSQAA